MADDRKRNRAKLEAIEERAAHLETQALVYEEQAGRLRRDAHGLRADLRVVLGMDPLPEGDAAGE
jgi:hypothetical protein